MTDKIKNQTHKNEGSLKIIPLGGVGTFGMNCTVIECEDRLYIVDAGMKIPQGNYPGVDLFYPDLTYIFDNAHRVEAVLLTHGHDDHIGALAYLLSKVEVPVYGTALTLALVRARLAESAFSLSADQVELHQLMFGEKVQVGSVSVEAVRMNHSIPDAAALIIDTRVGTIIHSGDFRVDNGSSGCITDLERLRMAGNDGVLLMLCDSTNADRAGVTPSENEVAQSLEKLISGAPGRVFITTFASHIQRMQMIINAAAKAGKKVALEGRRMESNFKLASDLGYIRAPAGVVIPADTINDEPEESVVYLTTGTQGEPFAALSRIARGDHSGIDIHSGDTVIFSSRMIPGNELAISRTIDNLFRMGAEVYYQDPPCVHVSGHGSRDEIIEIVQAVSPQYFIPVHGDYRHLVANVQNAVKAGVKKENVAIIETGDVLIVNKDIAYRGEPVQAGRMLVDGEMVADLADPILKERRRIARDGVVVVVVPASGSSLSLSRPSVRSVGVGFDVYSEGLDLEAARTAAMVMEEFGEMDLSREDLLEKLRIQVRLIYRRALQKKPTVIPIILDE